MPYPRIPTHKNGPLDICALAVVVTKARDSSGVSSGSHRHITICRDTPGETRPAAPSSQDLCSPTKNETTSTSRHVFANSDSAGVQITAVQVYIDNKLIYNDTSGATYEDTAFTVTKGTHLEVVKAFDANGKNYSEARNITAQSNRSRRLLRDRAAR